MIDKELWANVLSYNLVRKVAAQAARLHDQRPRAISFTATKQAVEAAWPTLSTATASQQLELGQHLLKELSKQRVGDRPNRCEPRAVKRRPKAQALLTKPRAEAKAELLHKGRGRQDTKRAAVRNSETLLNGLTAATRRRAAVVRELSRRRKPTDASGE